MNTSHKIVTIEQAIRLRNIWKMLSEKVVFTNGCFDILHQGHIEYLEVSRSKGNRLILGLNTDASISRIKGSLRPVVPEGARARVLAGLTCVDAIVMFDEDTPELLIHELMPDILTKGADYSIESIVGSGFVVGYGGSVETVDLVPGFSTSQVINKIKQAY